MVTLHVFTHDNGYIESLNLEQLILDVGQLGLTGEYSTVERHPRVDNTNENDITVSTYQAKAALVLAGKFDVVDAYMKLPATSQITKLKWEYSNFKRTDPLLLEVASELGMSSDELDQFFALASTIE